MTSRWHILAALTFARAAMGYQFQSIAAASPLIVDELHLDKAQLGWLIGLYLLPGIVIALPGGLLAARFGDKRLTLFGLALMAGGGVWLACAGSFPAMNAARLTSGTGAVILNVLLTKMVADWFGGRERVLAMSVFINSWPIGIGLALLAIGPLSDLVGWHAGIASATLFAAAGFVAVAAVYEPAPGASPPAAAGIAILDRTEWRLLAVGSLPWLLYNAAYQTAVSFLPSFLVESGSGISRAGAVTALNTVLFIVSVQAGGLLLQRAKRPDMLCHAAIIAWCLTLLLLSSGSTPMLWIVMGGLLGGLPASAFVSLPSEFLRPESRAAGVGVFYTIYYAGCAIVPTVAGYAYDVVGGAHATLWVAAGLAMLCVPALIAYRSMLRRARMTS